MLKLFPIQRSEFPHWKEMREQIYYGLNDDYHFQEMEQIFISDDWFCYFLEDPRRRGSEATLHQILGLVELSSRNIVDGCLTSPVAYLEGLYLKPEYRGKGLGKETIGIILNWCRDKGFSELATDTQLTNSVAQNFYQAVGFEETDRVVEFRIEVNSSY